MSSNNGIRLAIAAASSSGDVLAGCLAVSAQVPAPAQLADRHHHRHVPGVGGTVASFVAYGHAVQSRARRPVRRGDIRGVWRPRRRHDAKDGGPCCRLWLSASRAARARRSCWRRWPCTASRRTRLLAERLPLVFALIWSLFLSNWLTSLLGLALARPRLG